MSNTTHFPVIRALLIGAACGLFVGLLSIGLYGPQLILSGDQSIQLVAAESMLAGDGLKVPPPSFSGEIPAQAEFDLREKLVWYPPGYSSLLALLACVGLSFSTAALVIYLGNLVVSCALWSAVAARFGVPLWVVGVAFVFQGVAYMPATTTDQLMWPVVAGMFLLVGKQATWSVTILVTVLFSYAIWMRWFGVVLPFIWAAWIFVSAYPRLPKVRSLVLVCVPVVAGVTFYISLLVYLSGTTDPYSLPASDGTNWWLLAKGLYFALTGGISSLSLPLQAGFAVAGLLAVLGVLQGIAGKTYTLPAWIAYLALFQMIILCFLIYMQIKNGPAFMANAPAFAIPRFYSLAQPLSLGFLLAGISAPYQRRWVRTFTVVGLLLLVGSSAAHYFYHNKQQARPALAVDHRGFLRPVKFVELAKTLKEKKPGLVLFKSNWREVAASFDSKKVLPYQPLGESGAGGRHVFVVE